MTKELDTFSYAFMVELVDCPKKNAFPCRKGKPAMFRFGGGYYSFNSQGQLEDCHYYVRMCFYWVKPCPISWKALGIRVGVGYYHE